MSLDIKVKVQCARLPEDGLRNLCEEGFSTAIYLYEENFGTASKVVNCESIRGPNTLQYLQINSHELPGLRRIHALIHANLREYRGPVYTHCWNGWHASGYVSATALMQFCGISAEKAVAYWDKNTDGRNQEPNYERIRTRIRNFVPDPSLQLSPSEQALACPALGSMP